MIACSDYNKLCTCVQLHIVIFVSNLFLVEMQNISVSLSYGRNIWINFQISLVCKLHIKNKRVKERWRVGGRGYEGKCYS